MTLLDRKTRVLCAALLVATIPFPAAAQDKSMPTLTVAGEGSAAATPDMAIVSVGVTSQAARANEALAQNTKAMNEVIAVAKGAPIESRDIATSQISVRPQYSQPARGSNEPPKLAGYEASNVLSVRVRKLDTLGALIDRLVSVGANQLRGIELTIAEPGPLRDAARVAATKDAVRKAGILAEAAGQRIVRIVSIVEEVQDGPRPLSMRMTADAPQRSPVPIEAGEQEIRGRITAMFEIAPK